MRVRSDRHVLLSITFLIRQVSSRSIALLGVMLGCFAVEQKPVRSDDLTVEPVYRPVMRERVPTVFTTQTKSLIDSRRDVIRKLATPVDFRYSEVPLAQAVQDLALKNQILLVFDTAKVMSAMIDISLPINYEASGVRLDVGLDMMLSSFGLTLVPSESAVVITTSEAASARPIRWIFNIRHLMAKSEPGTETLVDCINTSIEPDTWECNGGTGTICTFEGMLVVTNTYSVLREVEAFLVELSDMIEASQGLLPLPSNHVNSTVSVMINRQPISASSATSSAVIVPWIPTFPVPYGFGGTGMGGLGGAGTGGTGMGGLSGAGTGGTGGLGGGGFFAGPANRE